MKFHSSVCEESLQDLEESELPIQVSTLLTVMTFSLYLLEAANCKAVAGSGVSGNVTESLIRFREEHGIPLYYRLEACLALGGAEVENEIGDHLAATRYYLSKAENPSGNRSKVKTLYWHSAPLSEILC